MIYPDPRPALVICYAYLWHSEYLEGREEGVKDRPCAIILTTESGDSGSVVTVVPVNHTLPSSSEDAIEIPIATKRRLGLDSERSWVVVSEAIEFLWPGPDLRPIFKSRPPRCDYGFLPPTLFKQITRGFIRSAARQRLRNIPRTE